MTTIWYSVDDGCDAVYPLEVNHRVDIDYLAEDAAAAAAEDYFYEHDGSESRWPVELTLFTVKDGPPIGTFCVEREDAPTFSARVIDET